MSSAEQNSPKDEKFQQKEAPDQRALQSPPKRPALVSPPKRPSRRPQEVTTGSQMPKDQGSKPSPAEVEATKTTVTDEAAEHSQTDSISSSRYQPIAPPSEPMQYRAIGLVRGTYQPTEADTLNRGALTAEDGSIIDAVLLGRVTSLVKKHIDLDVPHLWVVYPRTRRNDDSHEQDLHLQIVGVWEPETLGLPGEAAPTDGTDISAETPEDAVSEPEENTENAEVRAPETNSVKLPPVNDNYFSIRGEVVKYSPEEEFISVKILQGMKRSPGASKPFKVNLKGTIEGRTVGYFWDFKARRQDQLLVLEDASVIGIVPPKKRSKKQGSPHKMSRGGGPRPMPARRSSTPGGSSRPRKVDAGKDLGA